MKKLISAKTIEELYNSGKMRLEVDARKTIVTSEAQTTAQKLGVELVEVQNTAIISFSDRQKIIHEVQVHYSNGKFSKSKIIEAVKKIVAGLENAS